VAQEKSKRFGLEAGRWRRDNHPMRGPLGRIFGFGIALRRLIREPEQTSLVDRHRGSRTSRQGRKLMAEAVTLKVEKRDPQKNKGTGTRAVKRLRAAGRVPGIIYGHKLTPVPISLAKDDVWEMIKRSTHLAQLQLDDGTQMVLVRDVQWDHLGKEIIHLDFARVSADESITTEVRIDVRGTAPGVAQGGVLEQLIHKVSVVCRANAIPEAIRVDVSSLEIGDAIHVRELVLPPGVTVEADPDQLVVHVVAPRAAEPEPTEALTEGSAEPELIGRKPEDKEEEKKEK
jgi:large subunit ribosomal protein L25